MKKLLSLFLSATLVFGMLPAQVLAADLSGKTQESKVTSIAEDVVWGSDYDSTDKFTISSVSDLIAFAQMVNGSDDHPGKDFLGKTVYLEADLDLSDTTWVPIGSTNSDDGETHNAEFAGTFDGQDHSVSNISLDFGQTDEPLYDAGGFFGIVSGTVQNLTVNISVTAAADYLGGIAGYLKGGSKIVNCSTSGSITGEKFDGFDCGSYSGGIAGFTDFSTASKGITIENCCSAMTIVTGASTSIGGILGNGGNDAVTIVNCENTGAITGGDNVGGIVGDLNGVIRGCTNSGQVTSVGSECIGGIVGRATGATIENCSNTGTVSAINASGVGGIVGFVYADTSVSGCNNAGNISGSANIGGVVGLNSVDNGAGLGYTITDCTNSGDVSGTNNIGGIAGATRAFNKTTNTSPVGTIEVSRCINSGVVTGSEHVGGIVGSHNASSNKNTAIAQPAMVTGCINTGTVPEKGGAIVGYNNDNSGNSGNEKKPGIVEENFWPETLGAPGIAAGSGSADEEAPEAVKNNSSYDEDGNLTTPVTKDDGEQLDTMSKVVEEIFGGDADNIPETLKATVTFENNGHGTALEAQKVVIGTEIELPAMDNDGYWTFLGWMVDDQLIEGDSYTVTKDVTFKASWRDDTPSGGGTVVGPSKYAISVPTVDNGSVSVSPTAATKGKTVTITATPDAGYEVDAVSVTDRKGKAVKVTA
ncbi:MAG: GLUG motif-containing protein, partial [Peptococcaceae bacterium]|nr:GLUG motif-containing protein [Peptococcaceae bacterium]